MLTGMWIEPAARGTGAADLLIKDLGQLARDAGKPRLMLWVYDVSPRARRFYQRLGFATTGQRRTFGDDPRVVELLSTDLAAESGGIV